MTDENETFIPLPIEMEQKLIDELRDTFRMLPDVGDSAKGETRWLDYIRRLHELVIWEDPRRFLQWDVIKKTMDIGDADFVNIELDFLRSGSNWGRWQRAIREVPIGEPTRSTVYPASSGNLIHHAYHVAQFEAKTELDITSFDCIFEFGGGYGGMYRLIHNLGFNGKYVIFDFPAFSAIQQYFIRCIGLEVHTLKSFKSAQSGVICISDLQQLKILLSDHMPVDNGAFIATWSISECPMEFRELILSLLTRFKAFLIAYQGRFEGNDNLAFFDNWKRSKQQYDWYNFKIDHIPNELFSNNYYLIGQRAR